MFKTQAARERRSKLWCPMGRISIQKVTPQQELRYQDLNGNIVENPPIQTIPTGAFNLVSLQGSTADAKTLYLASICLGESCPLYNPSIRFWHWGHCGLAQPKDGPWMFAVAVVAVAMACTTLLFL